jgi:hypothetical protein
MITLLRVVVAKAWSSSGTQRKENIRGWKPESHY